MAPASLTVILPVYQLDGTANRRRFVAQAIRYFERQDYRHCELLIADDGSDPVADLAGGDPAIRYLRVSGGMTLGAKRNLACEYARGEIIVHWDDDDWQADWRLSYQVQQLLEQQADVCGVDKVWYYHPFLWSSQPKRLVALADNRFLVGLVHPGNTSVKRTTDRRWQPCAAQVIAEVVGEDWEFYRKGVV